MELLVPADGHQDQQILQDDNGAEHHDDDVESGEVRLFFILYVFFQFLGAHVLSEGIVGVDQALIVVLGIPALHGDRVAEHSGFTAQIHSHSGVSADKPLRRGQKEGPGWEGDGLSHGHV